MPQLTCDYCSKTFERTNSYVRKHIKRNHKNCFCSRSCLASFKNKERTKDVQCEHKDAKHFAHGLCESCYYSQEHVKEARCKSWEKYKTSDTYLSKKDEIVKTCKINARKRYESGGKEKQRDQDLQRKYGISDEEYQNMLTGQNNLCAICKNPETHMRNGKVTSLCVDHCHKTDKVRGLLCKRCNVMLGQSQDNIETLKAAIEYLKKNE